ncbi:hypothetical protein TI39_contig622g00006 [Zymoseptoria brevis]|uniref:protein-ribulosamine 3-kinase n=1 Tax=Zymoseptoria brevis TaxID=1047168 RepID=A0A0F4GGB6_9PEZI|nr:hypothetical protein TI39_contig622g00006 [Zymoseptoria brevis]
MEILHTSFSLDVLHDGPTSSQETGDPLEQVDIVAVPGLDDTDDTGLEDRVNWLKAEDMLPYWLPTSRILSASYASKHAGGSGTIRSDLSSLALELLRGVKAQRLHCPKRPLVFIGHSFGGVIIKQAALLCDANHEEFSGLARSFAGMVFLGTVHREPLAPPQSMSTILAAMAATGNGGPLHLFHDTDDVLIRLASDFARLAVVNHIPLFCFFEQPPDGDVVVNEYSATIDGFPSAALAIHHQYLCKFGSPDDKNYAHVRDRLLSVTQGAAGCVASRTRFPTHEVGRCLDALFVTDPGEELETIEHTRGQLLPDSGTWLRTTPAFETWLEYAGSRILWLNGDPGKGKTMLAVAIIKFMQDRIKFACSGPSMLLAYFFCDNKDTRRNNTIAVLRGIIYQLLHSRPDLSSQFRALFSREGDQLFSSPTALRSLWRILKDFFASPSVRKVYIVIDALDELHEESIDDFLKLLSPLLEQERAPRSDGQLSAQNDTCEVKWFLTSRNVHWITPALSSALHINLEEHTDQVQALVSKFISARVDTLQLQKGYSSSLVSSVVATLEDISEGTFLYVSMACDALARPNVRLFDTRKELRNFPKGLESLYGRMIREIDAAGDEEHVKFAKAILRTMVLAVRPLTLQELAVLAGLPEEHRDDTSMLLEYTALCGSFVTNRQGSVYFVHESVKEYLRAIGFIFSKPIEDYHADLFDILVTPITLSDQKIGSVAEEMGPVLSYARLFWMEHARLANHSIDWNTYLSRPHFTHTMMSREKWLHFYWHESHPEWDKLPENLGLLHLAAQCGITPLVETLSRRGDQIDAPDSNGLTPLIWATKIGRPNVVELLLKLGAKHDLEGPAGLTAVFHAAINGHYRSLEKLVHGGACVRLTDTRKRTALHYAAAYGNITTLKILLGAGADVDARDNARHTALQQASIHGEVAIMSVLVTHSANIGVKDKEGRTLLHLAARTRDPNVLEFWLKNSDDLESTDSQSWTPLMHAAMLGNHKGVSLLIKHGARIDARTRDGQTAISLAIVNTRVDAVKALLDGGADPNSDCATKETPLLQAAWLGNVAIVQSLLDAGADANSQTQAGLRPIHQAAANGHEICSKLLLRYGADPNAQDPSGHTPSVRAEENKHHNLAKYLKNREISCGSRDSPLLGSDRLPLDPAVCQLLRISPECGFMELVGEEGFSRPAKVTALVNGKATYYFMKSGPNDDMFSSEHEALRELLATVPTICPYSLGHGNYSNTPGSFLLMEWMDIVDHDAALADGGSGLSLPQKLAHLHNTKAKIPSGQKDPMFGWHRRSYCGSTTQINTFRASWPKFYAENRLTSIMSMIEETHGTDQELRAGVNAIVDVVVPRLLGNGHLGGREGIVPVLVHGDLWHGNKAFGTNPAWGGPEHIVFDPSAAYCHSEYEIGIMRAFGGFTAGFFDEYHSMVPKTEPVREYEDRVELYKLYHYLNHYFLFRGAYKDNAMDIVKRLADRYILPIDEGFHVLPLRLL